MLFHSPNEFSAEVQSSSSGQEPEKKKQKVNLYRGMRFSKNICVTNSDEI